MPDFIFETSLVPHSCRYLLGIDEVGRGPLAGPVTIGAFILDLYNFNPQKFIDLQVNDSKKINHQARAKIVDYFKQNNYSFNTFSLEAKDIDQRGISACIYQLIQSALQFFTGRFDYCLVDGNYSLKHPNVSSVVKGDQRCFSIASASIVAKEFRDQLMEGYSLQYPHYGFEQHRGYGTKMHLQAIRQHGLSPLHRRSFIHLTSS